jgi:hypothetical protein
MRGTRAQEKTWAMGGRGVKEMEVGSDTLSSEIGLVLMSLYNIYSSNSPPNDRVSSPCAVYVVRDKQFLRDREYGIGRICSMQPRRLG